MPSTPIYGLRYQSLSDAPNGAILGQNLATDVETTLQGNLTLGANLTVPGTLAVSGNTTVGGTLTVAGTQVNTPRFMGRAVHTGLVGASTVEIFGPAVTFTAVTGRRYMATFTGQVQGNTVTDSAIVRLRWKAGGTVDATGTQFRVVAWHVTTADRIMPFSIAGDVTGITAGTATIAISIIRFGGAGTVYLYASTSVFSEGVLMVEDAT